MYSDYLPTVITEASYLVTIPALKAHARGGVTLCGKIHFGSNLRSGATHLHGGLIAPNKVSDTTTHRTGYGLYRVLVDLMGHRDLGDKTVLFLVDGLWGGSEANDPPRKFSMTPFNNDWTSSIFASQDQVALESVCFDFLKAEYASDNPYGSYPQMDGADDHILQAADSTFWPSGIPYDPENDGSNIGSLGVCEHWNNPLDKQYSRDLGGTTGIELAFVPGVVTNVETSHEAAVHSLTLLQNYPNPFNPTTRISYILEDRQAVTLKIFDLTGRELVTLVEQMQNKGEHSVLWDASHVASGAYFCRLTAGQSSVMRKLIVQK